MSSSMERFEKALRVVLMHEGGYSNNKNDPGGATRYGVSLRYLIDSKHDINKDGKIDINDIKSMTMEDAKIIYLHEWWLKYKYDQIKSDLIATKIFDLAVNMGATQAHKIAQRAVNSFIDKPIMTDGIIGNKTLSYLNMINPSSLIKKICKEASDVYLKIIEKNPNLAWAKNGFLTRANWGS